MRRRNPPDDEVLLWAGVAGIVGLALWKGPELVAQAEIAANYVGDWTVRGNPLFQGITLTGGVVQEDPEVLREEAEAVLGYAADLDTLALAVMGRSEGVDGEEARMHVALNDLADLQATYGTGVYSSISALMLHSKVAAADGHFSEQYLGKRYATDRIPYEGDYHLAEKVRADHANGIDPTGGAVKFVDKDAFASQPGATLTFAENDANWRAKGLVPDSVAGASNNFVIYRKA